VGYEIARETGRDYSKKLSERMLRRLKEEAGIDVSKR
jgi:8-oxo-dGTP pyrophosphatase MutT (NUDIX family)